MEIILWCVGFLMGWNARGSYVPKQSEPQAIVEDYDVPAWTDEDEMKFDAGVIDYKDTDEYKKYNVGLSTENCKELKKKVLKRKK